MRQCLAIALILCISLSVGGCAVQSETVRFGESQYAPKAKNAPIAVLVSEPSRPYELIGLVSADKQAATTFGHVKEQDLYSALVEEARKLGADAILDVQFETYTKSAVFSSKTKHALKASAKAIRYVNEESSQSNAKRPPLPH